MIAAYLTTALDGRRRGRVASAQRSRQSACAHHVLHGDVDGRPGGAACKSWPATRRDSTRSNISPSRCSPWRAISSRSPNGAPLVLFGLPSNADAVVHDRIEIPKLGSLDPASTILHEPLPGSQGFSARRWPPVAHRVLVISHHGGLGARDLHARALEPARARPPSALRLAAGCIARRCSWAPPASSPSSQVG